jgi:hypothetical protein
MSIYTDNLAAPQNLCSTAQQISVAQRLRQKRDRFDPCAFDAAVHRSRR